jgi:hypothetical protein
MHFPDSTLNFEPPQLDGLNSRLVVSPSSSADSLLVFVVRVPPSTRAKNEHDWSEAKRGIYHETFTH